MAFDTKVKLEWVYDPVKNSFNSTFKSINNKTYSVTMQGISELHYDSRVLEEYKKMKKQALTEIDSSVKNIVENYLDNNDAYDVMFISDNPIVDPFNHNNITMDGNSFSVMATIFNNVALLVNDEAIIKNLDNEIIENFKTNIQLFTFEASESSRISLYTRFFNKSCKVFSSYSCLSKYKYFSGLSSSGKKHWFFYI